MTAFDPSRTLKVRLRVLFGELGSSYGQDQPRCAYMMVRYGVTIVFGVGVCALFVAMITDRRDLEPIVRFFHPFLLGRAGPYEPSFYVAYEGIVAVLSILPFVVLVWATATKSRTDQKIDNYLAKRMPNHEEGL